MRISRRIFLTKISQTAAFLGLSTTLSLLSSRSSFAQQESINLKKNKKMTITLPELPYAKNALEPHISEETLNFHYGKHHQTYVDKLNGLIANTNLAEKDLEEITKISAAENNAGVFNNAAQVWNHTFYWNSMAPNGGGNPTGKIAEKINEDFGSYEKFAEEFANAGATQFGSGWAWLILENGQLKITKTANAETPLTNPNQTPLLTMDVWEHAYYLDFQNARPKYISTFLEKLVNWDFVNKNLENA